jgi:hypothetical protein
MSSLNKNLIKPSIWQIPFARPTGKIPASNYISPTSSLAKKVKQIGNIPIKFPIHPILFMRSISLNLNASRQLTVEFSDGFPDGGTNLSHNSSINIVRHRTGDCACADVKLRLAVANLFTELDLCIMHLWIRIRVLGLHYTSTHGIRLFFQFLPQIHRRVFAYHCYPSQSTARTTQNKPKGQESTCLKYFHAAARTKLGILHIS